MKQGTSEQTFISCMLFIFTVDSLRSFSVLNMCKADCFICLHNIICSGRKWFKKK